MRPVRNFVAALAHEIIHFKEESLFYRIIFYLFILFLLASRLGNRNKQININNGIAFEWLDVVSTEKEDVEI